MSIRDKFKMFFFKLKEQIEFNNQLKDIFIKWSKGTELSSDELSLVRLIVIDTLKMVGLGSILLTPIPGGIILMTFIIKTSKKFGINLIPSKF